MTVLRELARSILESQCQALIDEHGRENVLRVFQEEADLLLHTEHCRNALQSDPFEHLEDAQSQIQRLVPLLQVTQYNRVCTKAGYCSIDAVVRIHADAVMRRKGGVVSYVELYFQYEIDPKNRDDEDGMTTVWYSIDSASDFGPRERCLYVQVFAQSLAPSLTIAQSLVPDDHAVGNDDDDEWEDIDDDEQSNDLKANKANCASLGTQQNAAKKPKLSANTKSDNDDEDNNTESSPVTISDSDKFVAEMDPDVLERLLHKAQLRPMDDITAFFLLMTFPFYEHEWDLIGFILDSVFGSDGDSQDGSHNS
jgi:hypothetical protein